jgi:uncharacterized RDD family membrane protein YckC
MSVATGNNNAVFGGRAMALAIDFLLLAAIQLLLFSLVAAWLLNSEMPFEIQAGFAMWTSYVLLFFVSPVFLHMFYFILFHAWTGQTIGKMTMGLRVVSWENRQVSPAVAFLRWTGTILSTLPLASGFLWAAVDKDHCAWHDRLAQTRVISVEMT